MKKIAIAISAAMLIFFAACSDDSSKNDGGDQIDEPVLNSGPNTEGERAKDAVKDSAHAGSDSTIRRDKDAQSTPH
jgi:hypothetical protein